MMIGSIQFQSTPIRVHIPTGIRQIQDKGYTPRTHGIIVTEQVTSARMRIDGTIEGRRGQTTTTIGCTTTRSGGSIRSSRSSRRRIVQTTLLRNPLSPWCTIQDIA